MVHLVNNYFPAVNAQPKEEEPLRGSRMASVAQKALVSYAKKKTVEYLASTLMTQGLNIGATEVASVALAILV